MTSGMSRREMIRLSAAVLSSNYLRASKVSQGSSLLQASREVVPEKIVERFKPLPYESQQIGGVFAEHIKANMEYGLQRIDEAAYLSGFLNRPVHPVTSDQAPGDGWVGEHIGKWLDGASHSLQYSINVELRALADRLVSVLIGTQLPDGYLGTYAPNQRWTGWDVWTHKYNLLGLMSYYELTGNARVLDACKKIGILLVETFGDGPGQLDITLNAQRQPDLKSGTSGGIESTSILEQICRLYRLTGDPRFFEFAKYIVRAYEHPNAPDVVRMPIDSNNFARDKAYEFLTNIVGLVDLYRLTGDETLLNAVIRDWEDISEHQLYSTGTVSSNEDFNLPGQLLSLFSSGVGENCATVTWLELNWRLLRLTGDARYGHEIERTVYNQLFAAHDLKSGGFSYFTSLTGRKEFKTGLFCCVSSGKRAIPLLPQLVWGLEEDAFVVNLYTSGEAAFRRDGVPVRVRSETAFPSDGTVNLQVIPDRAVGFIVRLRVPEWATHFDASVGSERYRGTAGRMLDVRRTWKPGDNVHIEMNLPVRVLAGKPTYPDYVAVQRGPQVLAIERQLNPKVPYLHRTALATNNPTVSAVPDSLVPPKWRGRQLYGLDGLAGVPDGSGQLRPTPRKLIFVPFADAIEYRVWTASENSLRRDIPASSAFARALTLPDRIRPGRDRLESITDEDANTFCTCDPRSYGAFSIKRGKLGESGEPVTFLVILDAPETVSRIVFRHGSSTREGGWFDTSGGPPRLEVCRVFSYLKDADGGIAEYPDLESSEWDTVSLLTSYPKTDTSFPSNLKDGQAFEVLLTRPMDIVAMRVIGKPGGNYATCAELGAYST